MMIVIIRKDAFLVAFWSVKWQTIVAQI